MCKVIYVDFIRKIKLAVVVLGATTLQATLAPEVVHAVSSVAAVTVAEEIKPVKKARQEKPTYKFGKHYVKNLKTGLKARVYYTKSYRNEDDMFINDKDYGHDLAAVFRDDEHATYENDTDTMTDYFSRGVITVKPTHPQYAELKAFYDSL